MLNWLSEKVQEYLAYAAAARTLADAATDPRAKKDYVDIEQHCLDRAQSYKLAKWFAEN